MSRSEMEKLPPDKLERLATLYLKLGQTDDCRAALAALLRTEPKNPAALRILARLEFRLHRFEEAAKAAGSALAAASDDADAVVIKAAALTALGRADEADKLITNLPSAEISKRENALGLATNHPAAQPDDAPSPDSPEPDTQPLDTALDNARAALEKRDLKAADGLTADAIKEWPHNKEAIALRADFLTEAGRPAEAIHLYRKLKATHDAASGPFPEQIDFAFALNDAGLVDEARQAFAVIIADKRYRAEDRKQAAKVIAEQRLNSLLAQGAAALERGSCDEAGRICDELIKERYASPDVQVFHADVLHAQGRNAEAAAIYEQIKKAIPVARRFDSQNDFAAALAGSLNYNGAAAAYEEIVAHPALYTEEEVKEARDELRDLHEDHFPRLTSELVSGSFDEGKIWRVNSRFLSMRSGHRRYITGAAWDHVELDAKLFPSAKTSDCISAIAGIEQQLNARWSGTLLVGGFNGGVMASVAADYTSTHDLVATLRLAANDPARDTLLLEAMNGRQHSLSVDVTSPLGKYFAIDSTLLARQIDIEGDSIGHSAGIESQFRWHPFTVKQDTWLAYVLEVKSFSARSGTFDQHVREFFGTNESALMPEVYDAIPKRINRHALQAHTSVPLTKNLIAAMTGEIARRFETDKTEYAVIGELKWKLNARADINARLEYDTGGAGPNTNGSVTLGTLGLKWSW